ncbi:hypothetical protein [Streptomyces liangshanensis]|uniref:Uncharacterized protein n=1 Tax=Streptomyces liangshanensis TaxID=2717324 RepID=A0A6G9H034_9ACTN|nr:hypothetical protein [Streptomyces liangshanensis]QIQ03888.1 hypothetical protein HA039_17545 [Streptomyces liangshanensis]
MGTPLNEGDGCELPATAVCWLTDDPQPGLILVEFADIYDRPHQLVGKTAYFGGNLQPTSTYPCPTSTECTIEEITDDVATVSTWWLSGGPEDTRFVFDVPLNTLKPTTTS